MYYPRMSKLNTIIKKRIGRQLFYHLGRTTKPRIIIEPFSLFKRRVLLFNTKQLKCSFYSATVFSFYGNKYC